MRHFTINEVERFSNIKAATLRVWEKRYGFCKPARNNDGNRMYSLADLALILNISLLLNNGFKISKMAETDPVLIKEKAASLNHPDDKFRHSVHQLILYKFSSDMDAFEMHLDECFSAFGIDNTLHHVIFPFLEKADLLSYVRATNQVHLTVSLIRRKLLYYIEDLLPLKDIKKTALLFLPEGEHYDLLLLYMCYLVKSNGLKPIYLGSNIAEENILSMLKESKPDYLYTYLGPKSHFKMLEVIAYLQQTSPGQRVIVVSAGAQPLKENKETVSYIPFHEFSELLASA